MNNDLDKNYSISNYEAIQAAYEKIWKLEQTQQSSSQVGRVRFFCAAKKRNPTKYGRLG